jgi:hypothetical protein
MRRFASPIRLAIIPALLTTLVATVGAQPAPYLRELPTPDRVMADFTGRDAMDTRARKVAAMSRLVLS